VLHITFTSTNTPSLSIPIKNKSHRKLSILMSCTLTDTQAVSAMRLLQQPSFHQDWSLGFLYSIFGFESVEINKRSPVTVQLWRKGVWRRHRSTDYYSTQYKKLSGQLYAVAKKPPVLMTRMKCGPQCRSALFAEVMLLPQPVFEPPTPILHPSHSTDIQHKVPKEL